MRRVIVVYRKANGSMETASLHPDGLEGFAEREGLTEHDYAIIDGMVVRGFGGKTDLKAIAKEFRSKFPWPDRMCGMLG